MSLSLYRPYEPPEALRPFVRTILVADCTTEIDSRFRPGPNGYSYLGWLFSGRAEFMIDGEPLALGSEPVLHVAGQIRYQRIDGRFTGRFGHVLAEFTPTGFHELLPIPATEIAGSAYPLLPTEHLWTAPFVAAASALSGCADADTRRAVFSGFLETLVPNATPAPGYVHAAVDAIRASHGLRPISEIAAEAGIGVRQLSRAFTSVVGVSPKYFARIAQLNHALALWTEGDATTLADLASASGFADQAHLARTIAKFFEESPRSFLEGEHDLIFDFLGARAIAD